ncbi:MAG: S8 family serine peptidase [Candidatus Hodarchaeales archaeon]
MKLKKTLFVAGIAIIFLFASVPSITAHSSGYFSAILGKPGVYVIITNPSDGDIVSNLVTITIDSNDNPTISIDGFSVGSGLSYDWDTTQYSDGSHTIEASSKGHTDTVVVTVDNGGTSPDNPPVVTITNPSDGATISGSVTIMVTVSDEDSLTPDIYIDGTYVATSSAYEWDTTQYSDGSYTVYAEATDSASQTGSDQISVTVDNSSPPPQGNYPWWNDLIDAEVAHANGITGEGSVVVIIDTGLGTNYVDLFPEGSILTQYCWSQSKDLGKDNVDWDKDTEGHGTACTATVIGYWLDLSDGTHKYVEGVAPDAKIVMIRTLYWVGGFGPPSKRVTETDMLNAWADAIYYAIDLHNGDLSSYNMVISMSLGYDKTNSYLTGAVSAAENDGIVLATSAGNDGHTSETTGYPANYADATSVAAAGWDSLTDQYGIDGLFTDIPEGDFSQLHIADFSSGGKVDITGIGENLILPMTDGYYYISGTSFSGPQVAGVYALMFQAWGSQSVQWLETKIQNTAYWNSAYMTAFVWGAGFVQADAAVS